MSPLWTIKEVANYLQIPVKTLYDWRGKKYGPKAKRIGRHLRYQPDDVIQWLSTATDPDN